MAPAAAGPGRLRSQSQVTIHESRFTSHNSQENVGGEGFEPPTLSV